MEHSDPRHSLQILQSNGGRGGGVVIILLVSTYILISTNGLVSVYIFVPALTAVVWTRLGLNLISSKLPFLFEIDQLCESDLPLASNKLLELATCGKLLRGALLTCFPQCTASLLI